MANTITFKQVKERLFTEYAKQMCGWSSFKDMAQKTNDEKERKLYETISKEYWENANHIRKVYIGVILEIRYDGIPMKEYLEATKKVENEMWDFYITYYYKTKEGKGE